jgi:DegV family protein with EDD domain
VHIVTDSGTDLGLTRDELAALNIEVIPLSVQLSGKTYREGIDIDPGSFYPLLESSDDLPTTSQPAVGEFKEVYERLAEDDPEILSIHISSGLSGTHNAALSAVEMVPGAQITVIDTKTLSAGAGWQVLAAAQAARAGWPVEKIAAKLQEIGAATESIYTLNDLTYLIHGGRISHIKGLLASVLNIKPLIGVEKEGGTYYQLGQSRSFKKAIRSLVDRIEEELPGGSRLRVQVLHADNPSAAELLRELVDARFHCNWLPLGRISLVLGAHTGTSMVGVAYAPEGVFDGLPSQ